MLDSELLAILGNQTKVICLDIVWKRKKGHATIQAFDVGIECDLEYELKVCGSYNQPANTLTYSVVCDGKCIYRLDLGKSHGNPKCINRNIPSLNQPGRFVGDVHKHVWCESCRDKVAYEPRDITATFDRPVEVWQQFCVEAKITHTGIMNEPRSVPILGSLI